MNTFFFTSSLCNTQFKQNLTHPESSAEKLASFFWQPLHWLFYPPSPVPHQLCFPQMLFEETGKGSSSGLWGKEQRGQSSTGAQGSSQRHQGELTMANSRWGQPQSTSMVISVIQLPCEASCASGRGNHLNNSKRGKQCQRNVSHPQTVPHLPYRLPSDTGQRKAQPGWYLLSQGPPWGCPFLCTSGKCFPCRLATVNAQRGSSFPSLLPLLWIWAELQDKLITSPFHTF